MQADSNELDFIVSLSGLEFIRNGILLQCMRLLVLPKSQHTNTRERAQHLAQIVMESVNRLCYLRERKIKVLSIVCVLIRAQHECVSQHLVNALSNSSFILFCI